MNATSSAAESGSDASARAASRSGASLLSAITLPLANFWDARDARERRLLSIGIAVALLGLLYLLLIEPALSGRQQLQKSLPALRQQVAQMQSMSREVSAMPAAKETAAVQPVTRESLESSLSAAGLKAQSVLVSGETIRLQFSGASFAEMIAWMDQVRRSLGISVLEASIVAQSQPDTVNANLTLRQQRRE